MFQRAIIEVCKQAEMSRSFSSGMPLYELGVPAWEQRRVSVTSLIFTVTEKPKSKEFDQNFFLRKKAYAN